MEFTLQATFNSTAMAIYTAWLDSEQHSEMIGGEAITSNQVGGEFTAWGDYIRGKNLELEPNRRIVQSWRTTEFSGDEDDSQIEVLLEDKDGQCELTLIHTNLPAHGEQYRKGWEEHYFQPMKMYFG